MPDQAAGLRSLFAHRRPSLLIVTGSDTSKGAVAAHFAREAAAAGRATVLIDGSAGHAATACGVSCRYELAQVMVGDKRLAEVLKVVTPHLLLLPAARALSRFGSFSADEEARLLATFPSGIADAFARSGAADAQVDLIVVNAESGEGARALDAFGRDARVVIVASDHPASLRGAYAEMKSLSQDQGLENFEIVVPVAGDAAIDPANNAANNGGITFANLANAARRFLDIELVDGGVVQVTVRTPTSAVANENATSNANTGSRASRSPLAMPASPKPGAAAIPFPHSTAEVSHAAVA